MTILAKSSQSDIAGLPHPHALWTLVDDCTHFSDVVRARNHVRWHAFRALYFLPGKSSNSHGSFRPACHTSLPVHASCPGITSNTFQLLERFSRVCSYKQLWGCVPSPEACHPLGLGALSHSPTLGMDEAYEKVYEDGVHMACPLAWTLRQTALTMKPGPVFLPGREIRPAAQSLAIPENLGFLFPHARSGGTRSAFV